MRRAVGLLLLLAACDRAPDAVNMDRMGIDNPGRTSDNNWVVGAKALVLENAEADARKQVARKNCRLIALPGDPPVVVGGEASGQPLIVVGNAPAEAETPETVHARVYAGRYNAVVFSSCASGR